MYYTVSVIKSQYQTQEKKDENPMNYNALNKQQLQIEKENCINALCEVKKSKMSLDLSRGKPSKEQIELSYEMLDTVSGKDLLISEEGQDCANYGGLDGIYEAKRLMAEIMSTSPENVIVGGNSSLTLMYQIISHGMTDGICGATPWGLVEKRKFLCPVPGYDRHFAMTEHFGFELISVPMTDEGPDMDVVRELVKDEDVKGIWCVPKYQNPTGVVYSQKTVLEFAKLKPAAKDFRIFWDNAYCVHSFDGENAYIPDIISECEKAGNGDMVYEFSSTSKMTFPGAGISAVGASFNNLNDIRSFLKYSTIGPNKINQLMHARFFDKVGGVESHMKKHGDIIRPKFEAAYNVLERELGGLGIASWSRAFGGYFFSYNTLEGCASEIVRMCGEYGVKFTPAGATHPYGRDIYDRDIRIAPTFATLEEIEAATRVLALCTKLVSIEKLVCEL